MREPIILIPARLAASRLPGKPLAPIAGEPMIVHVWRRACEAGIGPVRVATDSGEIAEAIRRAGGEAVMTREDHLNGSSRIFEAVQSLDPNGRHDVIVNLQGDLPTIDPRAIATAIEPLADPLVDIATLACVITREEERLDPSVVKAVGSELSPGRLRALYFTRATAPSGPGPLLHHVGLYAYRRAALERYVALAALSARSEGEARAAAGARGGHAHRHHARRRRCRSASTPPKTSNAPAPCWSGAGIPERARDREEDHRLSGRARRKLPHRLRGGASGIGSPCLRRPSRTPSRRSPTARPRSP